MQATPVSDQRLLDRLRLGYTDAREELARRHGTSLYALAFAIVWDSDVAGMLVAETFAGLQTAAWGHDPSKRSVFGWLTAQVKQGALRLTTRTVAADSYSHSMVAGGFELTS